MRMKIISETYNFFEYCKWLIESDSIDIEKLIENMTIGISGRRLIKEFENPNVTKIFIERMSNDIYRFVQTVYGKTNAHTYSEPFMFIN